MMEFRLAIGAFVILCTTCMGPPTEPGSQSGSHNTPTCPGTPSFGRHDSVEARSQVHRSILVTWPRPDSSLEVSFYQVYRSIATTRDTCDYIRVDTSAENFLSVREWTFIASDDTSFEDIIDLMDAVYWYGVKAVLTDSSDLWLGYDSAVVRNVYEYNPYVKTSSLVMKNVLLPYDRWARAGYPSDTAGYPYYLLDFGAGPYDYHILRARCYQVAADGQCGDIGISRGWGRVQFTTSELRDTLYVRSEAATDSIAYHMRFMPNGSLVLTRLTADSTVVDSSLAALVDSLGPLFKGPW